MEDDRRLGVGDQPVHDRAARHVREVDGQLALAATVELPELQLALDHVERALGPVDQDQPARPEAVDLACELGPDRAAGARDHHDLVADRVGDALGVGGDLLARKEVGQADLAQSVRVPAAVEQLVDGWHDANRQVGFDGPIHDRPDCLARGIRHRDQQHPRTRVPDRFVELVQAAEDGQPGDRRTAIGGVVVEEAEGLDAGLGLTQGRAGHQRAGSASPEQEGRGERHGLAIDDGPRPQLVAGPDDEPRGTERAEGEQQLEEPERPREALRAMDGQRLQEAEDDDHADHGADDRRPRDLCQIRHAGLCPRPAVEAETQVDERAHEQRDECDREEKRVALEVQQLIEADRQGQIAGGQDRDHVDHEQMPATDRPDDRAQSIPETDGHGMGRPQTPSGGFAGGHADLPRPRACCRPAVNSVIPQCDASSADSYIDDLPSHPQAEPKPALGCPPTPLRTIRRRNGA